MVQINNLNINTYNTYCIEYMQYMRQFETVDVDKTV